MVAYNHMQIDMCNPKFDLDSETEWLVRRDQGLLFTIAEKENENQRLCKSVGSWQIDIKSTRWFGMVLAVYLICFLIIIFRISEVAIDDNIF